MNPNCKGMLLSSLISAHDKVSFVSTLDQRQSFSGPLNITYSKFFTEAQRGQDTFLRSHRRMSGRVVS